MPGRVFRRGLAILLAEAFVEIGDVVETDFVGDFGDVAAFLLQQFRCPLQPRRPDEATGGKAGERVKLAVELHPAHAGETLLLPGEVESCGSRL